jgi:hypothetical protein
MIRRLSEIGIVILTIAYQFFYCDRGDTQIAIVPAPQTIECSKLTIKGTYKLNGKILRIKGTNSFEEEFQFHGEKGVITSANIKTSEGQYSIQNSEGTYTLNPNCTGIIYWNHEDKTTIQFATDPFGTHIYIPGYNLDKNSVYVIPLTAIR